MTSDTSTLAIATAQCLAMKDLEEFKKNLQLIEVRLNTSGWEISNVGLPFIVLLLRLLPFFSINYRPEQSIKWSNARCDLDFIRTGSSDCQCITSASTITNNYMNFAPDITLLYRLSSAQTLLIKPTLISPLWHIFTLARRGWQRSSWIFLSWSITENC